MPNLFPPPNELAVTSTVMGFDLRDLEAMRSVSLVDLADHMGEAASQCKAMRSTFEDGNFAISDEAMCEELDQMNGYLVLVAELMAYRLPREL